MYKNLALINGVILAIIIFFNGMLAVIISIRKRVPSYVRRFSKKNKGA
jgi:hypothetical protein